MNFSPDKMPYFNSEGKIIDFGRKRFQFWLETVPHDIRRFEYELYKRRRKLFQAGLYRFDNKKEYGRFTWLPEFSEDLQDDAWENFRNSFLQGDDRQHRFAEIISGIETD